MKKRHIQEEITFVASDTSSAGHQIYFRKNIWYICAGVVPEIRTALHETNRFQTHLDPWVHYCFVHTFFSLQLVNQFDFSKCLKFHVKEHTGHDSVVFTYFMDEEEKIIIPILNTSLYCDILIKFHNRTMQLKCSKRNHIVYEQ